MLSRRAEPVFGARLALLMVLCGARPAAAFCRQTTCDGKNGPCLSDPNGCVATGTPLGWPGRCLSFGVQQDGSSRRNVDYETFDTIVGTAFRQWLSADCGGGRHPSLTIWDMGDTFGPAVCSIPEYNSTAPNANVWILRDADWPYNDAGSALGHTTIHYEPTTGAIYDADVEINSSELAITTSNQDVVEDLQSIATHEAGHFLGLADSSVPDATMYGGYSPANRAARSLAPDDVAAICTLYPPERDAPACADPTPNHGYSRYCGADAHGGGCGVGSRRDGRAPFSWPFVVATGVVMARRRARRGAIR
jgi:hypothetical protein